MGKRNPQSRKENKITGNFHSQGRARCGVVAADGGSGGRWPCCSFVPGETPPATPPSAHELGHLGMQALVGDEVGALLKAFVALAAAKRPLARVHTPVVH